MARIDLNTLSQLSVVARHLNFRRAAAALALSPSTLSERIRGLEEGLGLRLLNRTTRSVSLTEEGQRLLDRTHDALAALDEATRAQSCPNGTTILTGRLRINGPRPAIELRLMPLLTPFLQANPGIRVDIVLESELIDVVAAGFDAGVRYDETLAQDMVAIKLGRRPAYDHRRDSRLPGSASNAHAPGRADRAQLYRNTFPARECASLVAGEWRGSHRFHAARPISL